MPAPERREHLVDTSLAVFAERGPGVPVSELAAAAGLTRSVFYYYFDSKQDLFMAVLERELARFVDHVSPLLTAEPQAAPEDLMVDLLDAVLGFFENNPKSWSVMFEHGEGHDADVDTARRAIRETALQGFISLLSADIARAGMDPGSARARVATEVVAGGILSAVQWWKDNPSATRTEVADGISDVLGEGLLTKARGGNGTGGKRRIPRT